MGEGNLLCIFCCYSFNPSESLGEGSQDVCKVVEIISKFSQQIKVNYSAEDVGRSVTVCPECFHCVVRAVESREIAEGIEVQVRSVQMQLLKLMQDLEQCMDRYLNEMGMIERKVKGSDVACLKSLLEGDQNGNEFGGGSGGRQVSEVFRLRDGIVKVVKDLSLFQNQLSVKVNPYQQDNNFIDSSDAVEVKVEGDHDFEEVPEFTDNWSTDLVDDDVEMKIDQISSLESATPKRSRRSAATTARERMSKFAVQEKPKKPFRCKTSSKNSTVKREVSPADPKHSLLINMRRPNWISGKLVRDKTKRVRIKMFHCEMCPRFRSKSAYFLEQHLREHEQDALSKNIPKSFSCPHCQLSFCLKQLYEYHMSCHAGFFKFMCDQCSKSFPPLELETHLKEIHGTIKLIQCDNCLYCCSTRNAYLKHLKVRHFGKTVIMACDLCPASFNLRKDFLKHLHEEHRVMEELTCGIDNCTRTFLDVAIMKMHQVLHTDPFTCLDCDYKCSTKAQLEAHLSKHAYERPWKCSRCPMAFKTDKGLKKHESLHDRDINEPVPAFQCHLCEKSYKNKRTLDFHLMIHDGQGFTCDHCGVLIANKSIFKRHLETHTVMEPKYFCDHCGKGFKSGQHLRRHVQTQHEMVEKKHKCPECHKTFHNKYNLNQHVRIHTGEKPFVCNSCGKAFNQAGSLWHHKKLIHGEIKKSGEQKQH